MGLYLSEGLFYRDVLAQVAVDVPDLIAVFVDEITAQSVIVMEDLVAAGAEFLRVTKDTLSFGETTNLLDQLASLHARWWNVDRQDMPPAIAALPTGLLPATPIGRYYKSFSTDGVADYLSRRALDLPARYRVRHA